jgi:hypothetical protein
MAKATKLKGKRLSRELTTPLDPLRLGLLAPEAERMAELEMRDLILDAKLRLLMDHCGIDQGPGSWRLLSIALASEFVRGFQERRKKGRHEKWGWFQSGILVVEIERLCKQNRISAKAAAKLLSAREPWKSALSTWKKSSFGADKPEALRRQYVKAKRDKLSQVLRDAYRHHQARDDLAGWDEMIAAVISRERK